MAAQGTAKEKFCGKGRGKSTDKSKGKGQGKINGKAQGKSQGKHKGVDEGVDTGRDAAACAGSSSQAAKLRPAAALSSQLAVAAAVPCAGGLRVGAAGHKVVHVRLRRQHAGAGPWRVP